MAEGFQVTNIDDKEFVARMNRIAKRIDKEGQASTEEIADMGRNLIQYYMPKATSESALSIGYTVVTNNNNYKEAKIVQIFGPHPMKSWDGEWFNVPFWMFESPNAEMHFAKSNGNIEEMRDVPKELQKRFFRRVTVDLSQKSIYY